MARPRKNVPAPEIRPGQAAYVLDRLIEERRISPGDVSRYVSEMHREISDLERRLNMLREVAGGVQTAPKRRGRPPGKGLKTVSAASPPDPAVIIPPPTPPPPPPGAKRPGRKMRRRSVITPEQLASRQLQGRYLGLIRQLPASRRKQYQKVAKEKGREAAIKEMASTLKK
ncbi:MAG TPA: hypothetical protein VGQ65_11665 [Thermoanaerobaculia bacterium]|jgi:hypothetical protein|nr:hypothetical protein [Thermoanaerobaculia bacterium]